MKEQKVNESKTETRVTNRDFPGGSLVKTSPSNVGGIGSIPGQGIKIPHASRPKNQNIKENKQTNKQTKQKQYGNKLNKD